MNTRWCRVKIGHPKHLQHPSLALSLSLKGEKCASSTGFCSASDCFPSQGAKFSKQARLMRHFELQSEASARGPRARSHLMELEDIKAEDYSSARGHIHRLIIRLVPNPVICRIWLCLGGLGPHTHTRNYRFTYRMQKNHKRTQKSTSAHARKHT